MSDLFETLNEEQKKAVVHKNGPLMIVAGAGTGKTTVITKRIAWLIEQNLAKPEEILALTFTEKAASEMEERVDLLLPLGYVDLPISTFHAFCERLLREYGVEIGLPNTFDVLNELDTWLLTRKYYNDLDLTYYRPLGNPTKYLKALLTHFSRTKDEAITPDDYLAYIENQISGQDIKTTDNEVLSEQNRVQELANVYKQYQQILLKNDSLDFGDLVYYTLQLLKTRPTVLKKIRNQYKYILVDEFQDTNWAQYELIKLLSAPQNNITVVGDDDQSIYKFRGASLSNILQFQTDFPDTEVVVLTKNYRSGQSILDMSYALIQSNNPNRLEGKSLKGDETINKQLESQTELDGFVEHLHFTSGEEEVREVAKKIVAIRSENPGTHWSDFAILVRANSTADQFVQIFERNNVPYQFMALKGLYAKPVIIDILAYLKVIDDPHHSQALYRVLTHAQYPIPMQDMITINFQAKKEGKTLFQICKEIHSVKDIQAESIETIEQLLIDLGRWSELSRRKTTSEVFVTIAKESGLFEHINQFSEQKKHDAFRHLNQFFDRIKRFEKRHDEKTIQFFLDEFQHERDVGGEGALNFDMSSGPDVVKIMTIHASKGLEFKYVFVVSLVEQRFPARSRKDPIELPEDLVKEKLNEGDVHIEEERRLFYVAMTRAKHGLFLTSADNYGGVRKKKISRFLDELSFNQNEPRETKDAALFEAEEETPKDDKDFVFEIPKQYSFTQLAAFKTCPLQYKFAHLLKIPVLGRWTFSYGKTMHNTLQSFFEAWIENSDIKKQELPVSKKVMIEMYEQAWIDDWYPDEKTKKTYYEKGLDSLNEYYAILKKALPKPNSIEMPFTLKIKDIVLKGRIDRIDTFEDGIEIIDYKTGKPKQQDKLTLADKKQLLIYQIAAEEILGLKPKRLTFHYLEDHSRVHFLGTPKQLDSVKEEILKLTKGIKESVFNATPGFHCKFCDFVDICEFRN